MSVTEPAEFLAPTVDTGLIPIVSPDHRRTAAGTVQQIRRADLRLVKVPLRRDGMTRYVRPKHLALTRDLTPMLAYVAVGNDDQPQAPWLSWSTRDRVATVVGFVLSTVTIGMAWLGVLVLKQ